MQRWSWRQTQSASFEGRWRSVLKFAKKSEAKATRQDRRVEFLLTRSLQRMLESDKLQQDQEDRERELSANRREIGVSTHISLFVLTGSELHFTKMCMYLHSCVQSDSNSQKHL